MLESLCQDNTDSYGIHKKHHDSMVQAGRKAGQCMALRGLDGLGLPVKVIKTWSDHYGDYPRLMERMED